MNLKEIIKMKTDLETIKLISKNDFIPITIYIYIYTLIYHIFFY
jgi:hypothetical protein